MPQPKVSIIIPVYNTEKYLRECLDSVLFQTLQDIEIIVVNDASPDKSQSIIDEYVTKDARIQCLVHPENLGLGGARNTGIAAAQGDYIAVLDSDDLVENHCYTTVIKRMEENAANLGIFDTDNFCEQGILQQDYESSYHFPYSSARKISAQDITKISPIMWNKVFKREDIQPEILHLPIHLKHEDAEFWFKYVSWVRPLAIGIPKVLHHRRRHNASITSNEQVHAKDYPQILLNIYHYLEKEHLESEYYNPFKIYLSWSFSYYRKLSVEYQQQYRYEMCHLFERCHLSVADILDLNPCLAVFYIEDDSLHQYFLKLQQDYSKIQQDHSKLHQTRQNHQKLQQDHGQLQDQLHQTSDELLQVKDQLHQTSDELLQAQDQLHQTSDELLQAQDQLHQTSDELLQAQDQLAQAQQDRWYRFGHLSRKHKLWVLARGLSKKLGMYTLLRPLAKISKGILEKKR